MPDAKDERVIERKEGAAIASKQQMGHMECSAKTEKNINEIFFESVRMISKWREAHPE